MPGGNPRKLIKRLVVLSLYAVLALLLLNKLTDPDLWWHLKSGQYILENRTIPGTDIFSFITSSGNKWIDLHWLFQVILFLTYKFLGTTGPILLQLLVITLAFSIFFRLKYDENNCLVSAIVFLAAIFVCEERFLVRPEMFTVLFIGIILFILEEYRGKGRNYLWVIPLVQVAWVNMQGLFILGPLLLSAYILGEFISLRAFGLFKYGDGGGMNDGKLMQLLAITAITFFACFLNPYGYRGVLFPMELFQKIGQKGSVFSNSILEFQGPFTPGLSSPSIILYKCILCVSLASFFACLRRIRFSFLFLYLIFMYLSLIARRNINIFALFAGVVIVDNSRDLWIKYNIEKKLSFFYIPVVIAIVLASAATITNRYYRFEHSIKRFGFGTSDLIYSKGAPDFIRANGIKGNMLNDLGSGGYLIWRLYPEKKVFIDGRLEVYGTALYNMYNSIFSNYDVFRQAAGYYNISTVIWNYNLPFMPGDFLHNIARDSDWRLVYVDNNFIIFLKDNTDNAGIIARGITDNTTDLPGHHLGSEWRGVFFGNTLGLRDIAMKEYRRAIKIDPKAYVARNNLASLYIISGEYREAIKELEKAAEISRDNPGIYVNLGIAYNALGDCDGAIKILRKGLTVSKEIPQLWFYLGIAYESKGLLKKAMQSYSRALRLNPGYAAAKESETRLLNNGIK
jgi:tetratricopeptide (TPR) repeat protein